MFIIIFLCCSSLASHECPKGAGSHPARLFICIYLNRKEREWDTHRVFLSEVLVSSGKHKIDEGPSSAPSNSYRVCAVGPEVCYSLFETWKSTQHVVLLE